MRKLIGLKVLCIFAIIYFLGEISQRDPNAAQIIKNHMSDIGFVSFFPIILLNKYIINISFNKLFVLNIIFIFVLLVIVLPKHSYIIVYALLIAMTLISYIWVFKISFSNHFYFLIKIILVISLMFAIITEIFLSKNIDYIDIFLFYISFMLLIAFFIEKKEIHACKKIEIAN